MNESGGSRLRCHVICGVLGDNMPNCDCKPYVYGEVVNARTGLNIKIYRNDNVSDEEMTTAVANAIAGYGLLNEVQENGPVSKIYEIHTAINTLSPSSSYKMVNGKKVLTYRCGRNADTVCSLLLDIATGELVIALSKVDIMIKMAKQMDNSKNTVRMAFGKVMGQRMI